MRSAAVELDPVLVPDPERALQQGAAEPIEHLDPGTQGAVEARNLLRQKTYSPKTRPVNAESWTRSCPHVRDFSSVRPAATDAPVKQAGAATTQDVVYMDECGPRGQGTRPDS